MVLAGLVLVGPTAAPARGQSAPASTPPALPIQVSTALQDVRDFAFDFGQAGFYSLLEYVKSPGSPALAQSDAEVIADWATLVERPGEFRGRLVTIDGVVGRNKAWRLVAEPYSSLGTVWQLELRAADPRFACTVILTEDATDIPIEAQIRVTGYFCLVRQYRSETNQVCQAPLIVAAGPSAVVKPSGRVTPASGLSQTQLAYWGAGLTAVMAVAFLFLRRAVRRADQPQRPDVEPASFSVAAEFQQWMSAADAEQTPSSPSIQESKAHDH